MAHKKIFVFILFINFIFNKAHAQVVINEGSNRNFSTLTDEDGEYPDWIELYNAGIDSVDLFNYSLTDDNSNPAKWTFPHVIINAGDYKTVFCSGKDRKPVSGFINVLNTGTFSPTTGWNTHTFTTPVYWDGLSNILINTCSYSSAGYISNSVFNQTTTSFPSSLFAFADGSPASCYNGFGTPVNQRPNMKLNGVVIGNGTVQNCNTCYPAPYGNWYWGARHQMLILASELTAAGLTAGNITSLAFDIVSTDQVTYDYIDFNIKLVSNSQVSSAFDPVNPNNFLHTNFKISGSGQESVYLYSPSAVLEDSLNVNCKGLDNSTGSFPDGSSLVSLFQIPTPSATNNTSTPYVAYLLAPDFSLPSGFYSGALAVVIGNTNGGTSEVHYTLDGSDPTMSSALDNGSPINISSTQVLKARAFQSGFLPSPIAVSTYFFGVNHSTPVLSVVTDDANLYGASGIFDNWGLDWQKPAYVEYFDSTQLLIFSRNSGMQMDGGAGGSRSNPQHSFRIELDNDIMGDGPVNYPIIPNRPLRNKYSQFYLRNGSNQYLVLPYKDACQVRLMAEETNTYYSAWRPISVYINGGYFGLYELREKFDAEYFKEKDGADKDSMDILSLSFWYGSVLRPLVGSVDSFYSSYSTFNNLNPADTGYWDQADQYFDQASCVDYIIGQSWMGNTDWPNNNIKLYRSNKSNYRWRFALIDQELAMAPNGWTDCFFDGINYIQTQDPGNPFINIWLQGIQNGRFKNYFINRYADVMNTTYKVNRLVAVENDFYTRTVTEMPNEYARWGSGNVNAQMADFSNNHNTFRNQLTQRNAVVRDDIKNNFNLPQQVNLTLEVYPYGSGKIHISTITPETYPWTGIYFDGVPVKIEAIPNPGYHFLHWRNNSLLSDTMNIVFFDTLSAGTINFKAYFEDNLTSVQQVQPVALNFSLFPNPASNTIYLVNNSGNYLIAKYQIIDLNGRIISEEKISTLSSQTGIDVKSLPASAYIIRIITANGTTQQFRFAKIAE